MDVQLSAGTFVDNDVLNLTDFQIRVLRDIASQPGFNGLVSPDLNQRRKREPMVVSYFKGTQLQRVFIGLYRSVRITDDGQCGDLKRVMDLRFPSAVPQTLQALKTTVFKAADTEHEYRDRLKASIKNMQSCLDDPDPVAGSLTKCAYRLAQVAIVFGNYAAMKLDTEQRSSDGNSD